MFKSLLKTIIVSTIFITSIAAQAGVIVLEDWFDSAGSNSGGLTQSQFSNTVYFAVAQDVDFSTTDTYEVAEGWHIATFAEYTSLHSAYTGTFSGWNMFNNDGWNGYTTASGTQGHYYFALADMFDDSLTNRAAHAGNSAGHNGSAFTIMELI
ncbi:MAG: hypothetical protein HRT53_13190 [Colwellia sp.]|nr:hypothetical protein [Colwellia sp.]